MSDFSGHTHNNPPMVLMKELTGRRTFDHHGLAGDGTSKSLRSPNSMDISSIISPPQSTWQQTQPHPIDTDSLAVSLPSPPQTSVPVLTTGKSPTSELATNQDSIAKSLTESPLRLVQMTQPPSRKRSLSPPIRVFDSEGDGAAVPAEEDDRSDGRPRKFWKSATGHRRGIMVSGMISIAAPTNYRRPPASIIRPHTSAPPTASKKANAAARSVSGDAASTSAAVQSSSPSPARQTESPLSPEEKKEDVEDEEYARDDSVDSDGYLVTTEDGRVVSIADSPAARKRRQNTIAARRSRQRKLEYVRTLEMKVEDLEKERDELRTRCGKAEEKVQWLREMIVAGRDGVGSRTDHGIG